MAPLLSERCSNKKRPHSPGVQLKRCVSCLSQISNGSSTVSLRRSCFSWALLRPWRRRASAPRVSPPRHGRNRRRGPIAGPFFVGADRRRLFHFGSCIQLRRGAVFAGSARLQTFPLSGEIPLLSVYRSGFTPKAAWLSFQCAGNPRSARRKVALRSDSDGGQHGLPQSDGWNSRAAEGGAGPLFHVPFRSAPGEAKRRAAGRLNDF